MKKTELTKAIKGLKKYDEIKVYWRDSETMPSGWTSNEELVEFTEEHLAETIGFFIGVTKNKFIVTAQSVDRHNNHSNQVINIPFENIKNLKKLGEKND